LYSYLEIEATRLMGIRGAKGDKFASNEQDLTGLNS